MVFTLLLKVSTIFLVVPEYFWKTISGGLILLVGAAMLFPSIWENSLLLRLQSIAGRWLNVGGQQDGATRSILVGLALGPVFSTCSPTYFIILATILPVSPVLGFAYLLVYVIGLCLMLYVVALLGRALTSQIGFIANSHGKVKKIVGGLLIVVGLGVLTGLDKNFQIYVLDQGFFDVTKVEESILKYGETKSSTVLDNLDSTQTTDVKTLPVLGRYHELAGIEGYINSGPTTLEQQLKDNKAVLVEFWTFGCINCKRTLPHLNTLYTKYRSQGLQIVGIHTPEFSYEKKKENVEKFVQENKIEYPVVLDNSYATWNSYDNRYWPRVYIINKNGDIVYDHVGEGGYAEADSIIQHLLQTKN